MKGSKNVYISTEKPTIYHKRGDLPELAAACLTKFQLLGLNVQ